MAKRKPESAGQLQGVRTPRGTFPLGASGNPAGRPPGARNRATIAAQALLEGEAGRLTRRAVELALAGDAAALRLCLERVLPPVRERRLDVPALAGVRGVEAVEALQDAAARGDLLPSEAERFAALVVARRKLLDMDAQTISIEEAMGLVEVMVAAVRREVMDPEAIRRISQTLERFVGRSVSDG